MLEAQNPKNWRSRMLTVLAVFCCLFWSFLPEIRSLVLVWQSNPNYSHGFVVIPIALVIAWRARKTGPLVEGRPEYIWGLSVVVGALLLREIAEARGMRWLETATLLPIVAGVVLGFGGRAMLRRTWPAISFLIFMLPLPDRVNNLLSQPLQNVATLGCAAFLRLCGLWALVEGNDLIVGTEHLEVATVCNGLSMLLSLAATVTATTLFLPLETWKRVALLTSVIPIALACNILRIAATAWCYQRFGAAVGARYAHDAAGWLMMPSAIVLVGLELTLLDWIVQKGPIEEEATQRVMGSRSMA